MIKRILLTGGSGYIGSHIAVELIDRGYEVVIVDNFSNSDKQSIQYIENITQKSIKFYQADIRDKAALRFIFSNNQIDACIHCAGLKAVGESITKPLEYYDTNIAGTLNILKVMREFNCKNMIFSSSATVYGTADTFPITEDTPKKECTNPYGWSKSMIEQILMDLQKSDQSWNIILLRYFNPIGAHKSGKIGENPKGIPNNLMPYITQVAVGKRPYLSIFGNDYNTPDGTGVRDYIHVVDLAKGHIKSLDAIKNNCGLKIYNLSTGKGYSVLEIVQSFEKVSGVKVPYKIEARRNGDIAICYSSPLKAEKELGWKAEYTLEDMCKDAWNRQKYIILLDKHTVLYKE